MSSNKKSIYCALMFIVKVYTFLVYSHSSNNNAFELINKKII